MVVLWKAHGQSLVLGFSCSDKGGCPGPRQGRGYCMMLSRGCRSPNRLRRATTPCSPRAARPGGKLGREDLGSRPRSATYKLGFMSILQACDLICRRLGCGSSTPPFSAHSYKMCWLLIRERQECLLVLPPPLSGHFDPDQ